MIRRVQQIKSFGIFSEFQWPAALPEFKRFNLIYGWNYSGKTTLSRAFRCFEQQQCHPDFPAAQVQLKSYDGATHHLSIPHTAPPFRVFNTDFVRENISFDSASASPILVLGAEDIAKQELLKNKKAERDVLAQKRDANHTKISEKVSAIEKALTKAARDLIKNQLSVPNYDKTRFEPKVKKCKDNPAGFILGDEILQQYLTVYRSSEKRPSLSTKSVSLTSVTDARSKAEALLAKVVTANKPIPRLQNNSAIEAWVKEGRSLHDGKTHCQFCGQLLPADLLNHLTEHFSADYENLMSEATTLLTNLVSAREEGITLDHKKDFYPELQEQFSAAKGELDEAIKSRKVALAALAEALKSKQTKAFNSLECPVVGDPADQISSAIEAINKCIVEHNSRTSGFEKKRQDAFEKLELHYAASFVRDEKYNEVLQQIPDLRQLFGQQNVKLDELERDIRILEKELSEASRGAERINELLFAYFGKKDLRVEVSADKRFQLVRAGVIAKNLSEGEKTAIAFAHFITRIQDGRRPLDDIRVVIDDPISSLDANHLFNTYSIIKTQLGDCRQLFIVTHSFEFYNLIRDWLAEDEKEYGKKPQTEWKKWSAFIVRRTDDENAVLEEIPKELLRFRSEYHYLFSVLYHFNTTAGANFDSLMSLPNIARRFLEAFGGIMIPVSKGLRGKMERLFPDDIVRERVWKFVNQYSHNTTVMRSLTIPDTSECIDVVKACLKAVRDWDTQYFADLESEVL
jgi:wobble nucleotide-excising tRNase